jgi:hypothetical protein
MRAALCVASCAATWRAGARRTGGRCRSTGSGINARQEFALPYLLGHGTDVLIDHGAGRVDQKTLRCSVHAPVDRHPAVTVGSDALVGIAELRQPRLRVLVLILPVDAEDRNARLLLDLQQHLVFGAALSTPGAPDVDQ